MALASDVHNQDFAGAQHPDAQTQAIFYSRPIHIPYLSEQEGRPIYKDVVYVKIVLPGNAHNIIDTPVREDHKARFPMQWAHFKNTNGDSEAPIGTPLSQWPILAASKVEELKAMKFMTVEAIAFASDEQISRLGMVAGTAPMAFREKAKRFLSIAKDTAVADKQAEQLAAQNAQIAAQNAQIEQMKKNLEELTAKLTEPRKRQKKVSDDLNVAAST